MEKIIEQLKDYELSVKILVTSFIEKFLDDKEVFEDFNYDKEIDWIGDEVGEVFTYGDYCINFNEVVQDLKYNACKGLYEQYYEETLERGMQGKLTMNYMSYMKGLRYEDMENPIYFRQHRGSLDDSLATKRRVKSLDDVLNICDYGLFKERLSELECEYYAEDKRMKDWAKTYIITALLDNGDNEATRIVLGFSNAELK